MTEWFGDNPYYVLISSQSGNLLLDLDEPGWAKKHEAWLRIPSRWHLFHKDTNRAVVSLIVYDGDQPYYTKRTVGAIGSGGSNQVAAYGIGKKQKNGDVMRLWVMSNGVVVGGDDVDQFGIDLVYELGPQ